MWSSTPSWCYDCSQWSSCTNWRQYFTSRRRDETDHHATHDSVPHSFQKTFTNSPSGGSQVGRYGGVSTDDNDTFGAAQYNYRGEGVTRKYNTALDRAKDSIRRFSGNDDDLMPFKDIDRNTQYHQSIRKHSTSSSDFSIHRSVSKNDAPDSVSRQKVSQSDNNSDSSSNAGRDETSSAHRRGKTRKAGRGGVNHHNAIPLPTSVAVTLQPKSEDIFRPDLGNSPSQSTAHLRQQKNSGGKSRTRSVSMVHRNTRAAGTHHGRVPAKKYSLNYITPEEAATPASWHQRNRTVSNSSLGYSITDHHNETMTQATPDSRHRNGSTLTDASRFRDSMNALNEQQEQHHVSTGSIYSTVHYDTNDGWPQPPPNSAAASRPRVRKSGDLKMTPILMSQDDVGSGTDNTNASQVVEKGPLSRLWTGLVGGTGDAKYEYQSSSGGSAKVQLRSKSTAQSIATRKVPQPQALVRYTFGFVTIAYKCSREKIVEVDVLSVTCLPRYSSTDPNISESVPSLSYVDIEVCLRLASGKELVHKIKKFKSGDVPVNEDNFEPECTFRRKELEHSTLVLTVSRRKVGGTSSPLGHGMFTLSRQDLVAPEILRKTLPLKQGFQMQEVNGSAVLALTCSHPSPNHEVTLTVNLRLLQHLDVTRIGVPLGNPKFKIKPEIKIRIQLRGGSLKSQSSSNRLATKHHDFPWISIQNSNGSVPQPAVDEGIGRLKNKSSYLPEARSFGGWGTLFPDGCSMSRLVHNNDLRNFSVRIIIQIFGRNNVGPAAKKEVLLGIVVLGPELQTSEAKGQEETSLTHWGEVVTKRSSVEVSHRLHL